MCDAFMSFFKVITGLDWLEIIKAFSALATAIVAFYALRNWKRQDRAKREVEFLDALIDATHEYIAETPKAVTLLETAKIGMQSHKPIGQVANAEIQGAIDYINKRGEQESKRLRDELETVQPVVFRLRSLATKGQMFGFEDYPKCFNAVAILTWQFARIESFMSVIGSPSWNWQHPQILELLEQQIKLDPNEIRQKIKETNTEILAFAQIAYKRNYG